MAEANAGTALSENLQDVSGRTGLSLAGWKPRKDMHAQAVEWWSWDWETSSPPEQSSFVFGVARNNLTFNQFSDENNFVTDQRGFNKFVIDEASEFLAGDDTSILLERVVTGVTYSRDGVTVQLDQDECIEAQHAICTFSLGVLQSEIVKVRPALTDLEKGSYRVISDGNLYENLFSIQRDILGPR